MVVVLDATHSCCSVAQRAIQAFPSLFTVLHQQPQWCHTASAWCPISAWCFYTRRRRHPPPSSPNSLFSSCPRPAWFLTQVITQHCHLQKTTVTKDSERKASVSGPSICKQTFTSNGWPHWINKVCENCEAAWKWFVFTEPLKPTRYKWYKGHFPLKSLGFMERIGHEFATFFWRRKIAQQDCTTIRQSDSTLSQLLWRPPKCLLTSTIRTTHNSLTHTLLEFMAVSGVEAVREKKERKEKRDLLPMFTRYGRACFKTEPKHARLLTSHY